MLAGDVHPNPGPKFPCGKCGSEVNYRCWSIQCAKCKLWHHQRCTEFQNKARSDLPRDGHMWKCANCSIVQSKRRFPHQTGITNKTQFKILQWNVGGGIAAKKPELEKFLHDENIDVALLQETHLEPTKTFRMKGFNVVRRDRNVARGGREVKGGGVMALIKEELQYSEEDEKEVKAPNDATTEAIWLTVHSGRGRNMHLLNAYVPPIRNAEDDQRRQAFDPNFWPKKRRTIICADVNAHSALWENQTEEDQIGRNIEEWMAENSFLIANDGRPTRIGTNGQRTTPDVTIYHPSMANKVQWDVKEELSSDHLPIVISVMEEEDKEAKARPRPPSWNWKKAKWDAYKEAIVQQLSGWKCTPNQIKKKTKEFTEALIVAAGAAIPRGRRKKFVPWWSQEAEEWAKRRNEARKEGRMEDCADANKRLRKTVRKQKEEKWQTFATGLDAKMEEGKVWSVMKAMDGRIGQPKAAAAITKNGRRMLTLKQKANAFVNVYAQVSKLKGKEDSNLKRRTLAEVKTKCDCECCRPFQPEELCKAIGEIKMKKAPGEDGICGEMLANLPQVGEEALLQLINASWQKKEVPTEWMKAKIIPIPKPGKDIKEVESYRPISLTSVVAKTAERMVKNRLMYWMEAKSKLSEDQAGFRRGRSTEDQLLKLLQSIGDGFNKKPPKRTIMTLIDFSRAFDKVWRNGLYNKMEEMSVPRCIIQWVRAFLRERRAQVHLNGTNSNTKIFKEGVPQGTVLGPVLFLIYINDILKKIGPEVECSLYADDLAIWTQSNKIEEAKTKLEEAVNEVRRWAEEWRMGINFAKCEIGLFTTDPHQARMRPTIMTEEEEIPFNANPTFLGLKMDRTLSFGAHVKAMKAKMARRLNIMKALRGTNWGCRKKSMKTVYQTYIRPIAEYGMAAWAPPTSETTMQKIEVINNQAARIITGCGRSTPCELLLEEAGILPMKKRSEILAAIALEKAHRLPDNNPRSEGAKRSQKQRLKTQHTWREMANTIADDVGLNTFPREGLEPLQPIPPWLPQPNVTARPLLDQDIKKEDEERRKNEVAKQTLAKLPPPCIEIYTDGSVKEEGGGSGWIAFGQNQEEIGKGQKPAGVFCSSYRAELTALHFALKWLEEEVGRRRRTNEVQIKEVRICTDSQSLVQNIKAGPGRKRMDKTTNEVWERMAKIFTEEVHLTLQWIPGHAGIVGNVIADDLANRGAKERGQKEVPIDYKSAKAKIKGWAKEERKKEVEEGKYAELMKIKNRAKRSEDEEELTAKEQRIISQLRCNGHCTILRAYQYRIGISDEPTCLKCNEEEETIEHMLLNCAATEEKRGQILGPNATMKTLWEDPKNVLKFLRNTDRFGARQDDEGT